MRELYVCEFIGHDRNMWPLLSTVSQLRQAPTQTQYVPKREVSGFFRQDALHFGSLAAGLVLGALLCAVAQWLAR